MIFIFVGLYAQSNGIVCSLLIMVQLTCPGDTSSLGTADAFADVKSLFREYIADWKALTSLTFR